MRCRVAGAAAGLSSRPLAISDDESAQLGVSDRERIVAAAPQPVAELQQVGAVGLERVARQAALELEVGEEVEQQVLERVRAAQPVSKIREAGGRWGVASDTSFQASARRATALPGATRGSGSRAAAQARLQQPQPDDRLRVAAVRDRLLELGERMRLDVDPLVLDLPPGPRR